MRTSWIVMGGLLVSMMIGCGESGYKSREAPPGEADPSAAMSEMGNPDAAQAPEGVAGGEGEAAAGNTGDKTTQ